MYKIIAVIIGCSLSIFSFGQGCSDAGGCSVGAMSSYRQDTLPKKIVKVGYSWGDAKRNTQVHQWYADAIWNMNPSLAFQLKIPFQLATGELGNVTALGDIVLGSTYTKKIKTIQWKTGISFRLPTGTFSQTGGGSSTMSLPMVYQSSLGTFDVILNSTLLWNGWTLGLGYQQVLVHNNSNNFLPNLWNGQAEGSFYEASNQLKRGNDFLARLEYRIGKRKIQPILGTLFLYRLKGDSYLNVLHQRVTPEGSKGTTLNILAGLSYTATSHWVIEGIYAQPLINRTVGADGLLRSKVVSIQITYRW